MPSLEIEIDERICCDGTLCRPAGAWSLLGSDSRDSRPWLNYVAAPRLGFRPAMTFAPVIFNSVESRHLSRAQQKCQISSIQTHVKNHAFSSPPRPSPTNGGRGKNLRCQ